jgi:hypothetical protein
VLLRHLLRAYTGHHRGHPGDCRCNHGRSGAVIRRPGCTAADSQLGRHGG